MGTLKNYSVSLSVLLILAVTTACARAAPPVDLVDPQAGDVSSPRSKKGKEITEDDMTYVDGHQAKNLPPEVGPTIKFDVVGRKAPRRDGKGLIKLNKNQKIRIIKNVEGKDWVVVETYGVPHRKAWVPRAAIAMPVNQPKELPKESPEQEPEAAPNPKP